MIEHNPAIKQFISILMESPLYLMLTLKERQCLLDRLAASYPFIYDGTDSEEKDRSELH